MSAARFIAPDTYSLSDYAAMIAYRPRIKAYAAALERSITPDSIVLDIGSGAGAHALLACQLGARRVIAVEPHEAIDLARTLAVQNGYGDRIEFIQDVSLNVTLSEPADVIVSDLRGALPLFRQHIPCVIDARERFLAPTGVLIPQQDRIWATIVEEPVTYRRYLEAWRELPGLDMEVARRIVANQLQRARIGPDQFLAERQCWTTLDYVTIDQPNVAGRLDWRISRAGTGHGLSLWFDGLLADNVPFDVRPWERGCPYWSMFFPFTEPLALAPGDMISVGIQASLIGTDYVWRWETTGWKQGDPERKLASFSQSTLHGVLPGELRRVTASHRPTLNEQGRLDGFILRGMADHASLDEIARQVSDEFPARFGTLGDALAYVSAVSARYSE